jgi:transposase InsO family protein
MMEAMGKSPKSHKGSVSKICMRFGLERDAYYKFKRRDKKRETLTEQAVSMVKERRKDLPREGCRKLHEALRDDFEKQEIKIGQGKLFAILRERDMLVKRKRSGARTTNSYHHFHKYTNLIKGIPIVRRNQVWVCDITYIRLLKGFCYLVLITDAYSRKIVGYDVSDSLELTGCKRALQKAQLEARPAPGLIHHSDRGVQYCSNEYVGQLKKYRMQISMTEENHCYENAMAERVNGILKDEFYLDQCFMNVKLAKAASKNAIRLYNTKRLHLSLGYKTPDEVFKMSA